MRLTTTALALTLTTFVALAPAHAEGESHTQKIALAAGYIEATLQDIDMSAMIQTMWKPLVADIQSKGIPLDEGQIAKIDQIYQDEMTEPMYEIMRAQAQVMADVFTFEEIKALRDFYATDLGRSAMSKLPQLAEVQTPQIMKTMQEKMPIIIPRIQEILVEGVETESAQPQ
ncbi:hypothetical protein SAMN04488527_11477 [Aliiroseovarius crassostreae]|uniref:DUF2059 domain-containing protein n=1 Tax=Aliiroseovarius crassostreae TaxID=154981 RepID=A0A0P7KGE4_9RHOB|nr:DUF2059 domain-containing protein [Aliiroseovarius crassostreae]KPN62422.1 hypothetical protein AKJ29_09335 [Aliiroseovarius crassostreae]SFU75718.1 hypothetical protein SAMN04488527_11477 [Aliiroseovarius crassostreae]